MLFSAAACQPRESRSVKELGLTIDGCIESGTRSLLSHGSDVGSHFAVRADSHICAENLYEAASKARFNDDGWSKRDFLLQPFHTGSEMLTNS